MEYVSMLKNQNQLCRRPRPRLQFPPRLANHAQAKISILAPPPPGTLGIRYGRCYTLSNLWNAPITRHNPTGFAWYYFGHTNPLKTLVFRVCHNQNKTSCDSIKDEYVLDKDGWTLLDQSGLSNDGKPEFVGSVSNGIHYLAITNNPAAVVDFQAKIRCVFGKCVPCLRIYSNTGTAPKEQLGLTNAAYQSYGGDTVQLIARNDTCYPVVFQETSCSYVF